MDRLFVDTDVIIDLLDQRDPFYLPAAYLFSKADKKELKVIISSLSFTSIHYVLRKKMTNLESRKVLARFHSRHGSLIYTKFGCQGALRDMGI